MHTHAQAQEILIAWNHINPSLSFSRLTVETFSADLATVKALKEKIMRVESELINLRNERDAATLALWDKVKRARVGIKAVYGDDSSEYELAGGTRLSDRKKPRRKVTTTKETSEIL